MKLESATLHVTLEAVRAYAGLTDDFNPIHLDAEFAAASPMNGRIAHGTLSLGVLWQALARSGVGPDGYLLDIRFLRPVRLGDRVTAGGDLASDSVTFDVWVRNDRDDIVIAGTARPL
ncbi:MAG: MaoC family dehydratase [Ottowia sp.]|uniref:MaoC family dehydratase n=1 Tax=Ottowia sp. TaxID=1898956 RepID=UPI003C712C9F